MIGVALLMAAVAVPAASSRPALDGQQQALLALRAVEHGRLLQAHMMLDRIGPSTGSADPGLVRRISAKLALAEGDYGKAEEGFEQLLAQSPTDCEALEGAGVAAAHAGRDEEAQGHLRQAEAHCALSWRGWNILGVLADRAGRWSDAAAAYAQARQRAPAEPSILNNIGYSLLLQKRYDEAAEILRQARAMAPADQRFENNLDVATVAAGEAFDQSSGPDEARARRLNNAGYAALLSGRDEEAVRYLAESQRIDPRFSDRTANNLRMIDPGGKDDR